MSVLALPPNATPPVSSTADCAWCGAPAAEDERGAVALCRGCLAEHVEHRALWYEQCAERSRRTADLFDAKARLRRLAPNPALEGDECWFAHTATGNRAAAAVFATKATALRERVRELRGELGRGEPGIALCAA